ncbi:MAG: N-acetylmuramoyl-L-alanine amidase [Pseudomonadota bacterium]
MRLIQRPSPNFNDRREALDLLVLHYTGMEDGETAEARLCESAAEVSAHYVVREDGTVVQMVAEDKRAWHAGVAAWQGENDLNSRSIGIEIINGGHDFPLAGNVLPPFPHVQVAAVISLCRAILSRHGILPTRIVGHSDIAPTRKRDPGEHFPWQTLADAGIGLWPSPEPALDGSTVRGRGLDRGETSASVERMQAMLVSIGYDLSVTGTYDENTQAVVTAFQRRWRPEQITGQADLSCLAMIGAVRALYCAAEDGEA